MDNIVDYLVVLFFIISFLASIFKKKKNTPVAKSEDKILKTQIQNPNIVEKKKAANPFEDFFKSINDEIVKAKAETTRSEVDEYYENAMQKSADVNYTYQSDYKQREYIEPVPEQKFPIDKLGMSIKSYDESLKQTKEKHESKKAKEIRNRLKQNTSIKDFIIISEILGKPKALQR
jgi:hypothetical protein